MNKAATRKYLLSELSKIDSQIQEIEFKIAIYDDTFSDSDEFPLTKEDLVNCLEALKETRKDLEKQRKEVERL